MRTTAKTRITHILLILISLLLATGGLTPAAVQAAVTAGFSAQKAVLVIGPVVSDTTWDQTAEEAQMEQAASVLEAQGISVVRFYYPNTQWADIAAAAQGANYFLYRGEGIKLSSDPPVYGGLYVGDNQSNVFITPDDIRNDLALADNALVLLYACWTAGSAAGESGITGAEALERVAEYSNPFIYAGAGGYISNWADDSFADYLTRIFAGETLGQAYLDSVVSTDLLEQYRHPDYSDLVVWLDSEQVSGGGIYHNAFAGNPTLTVDPTPITYLTEKTYLPAVSSH